MDFLRNLPIYTAVFAFIVAACFAPELCIDEVDYQALVTMVAKDNPVKEYMSENLWNALLAEVETKLTADYGGLVDVKYGALTDAMLIKAIATDALTKATDNYWDKQAALVGSANYNALVTLLAKSYPANGELKKDANVKWIEDTRANLRLQFKNAGVEPDQSYVDTAVYAARNEGIDGHQQAAAKAALAEQARLIGLAVAYSVGQTGTTWTMAAKPTARKNGVAEENEDAVLVKAYNVAIGKFRKDTLNVGSSSSGSSSGSGSASTTKKSCDTDRSKKFKTYVSDRAAKDGKGKNKI